jgi:ribonuclease HI
MTSSNKITIFTDGACKGNPGRGGWAAVLVINGIQYIESGRETLTTNNRMELMAAIKGLEAAPPGKEVTIYSDSAYLVNTMTRNWKRNANHDLWERLDQLCQERKVSWKWVRGHNGTPGNEMADRVASMEAGLFQQAPFVEDEGTGRASGMLGKSKPASSSYPSRRIRRPRP